MRAMVTVFAVFWVTIGGFRVGFAGFLGGSRVVLGSFWGGLIFWGKIS